MKTKGQKAATRRARQRQVRALAFGFIALLVLGTATYLLATAFTPKMLPPADANTIDIRASMAIEIYVTPLIDYSNSTKVRLDNFRHLWGY